MSNVCAIRFVDAFPAVAVEVIVFPMKVDVNAAITHFESLQSTAQSKLPVR
jgi:hypothetical protein